MKFRLYFLSFSLVLFIIACKQNEPSAEDETKAQKVIRLLNDSSIQQFREWNYYSRGGNNWERLSADTVLYTVNFSKSSDTTHLFVYRTEWFAIEFECNYLLNHEKYYLFDFAKYQDSLMCIVAAKNDGKDTLLETNLNIHQIFKTKDPFAKLSVLNALKDSLGVMGISYRKKHGNFTQFYLSAQTILTYLPNNLLLIPKEVWEKEFAKGKTIKPNWNLRGI